MNTLRVCTALGLSLMLTSACKNNSSSGGQDAATSKRDAATTADTKTTNADAALGPCTINGVSYQAGQSVTVNCVTFTCDGSNSVSSRGNPCSDAADSPTTADVRAINDGARAPDQGSLGEAGGGRDVLASEAGMLDGTGAEDVASGPEVALALDTAIESDSAALGEDATISSGDDAPAVLICSYGGQNYLASQPGQGVPFPCGCKTCECDIIGTAAVIVTVADNCAVDAQ